METPSTPQQTPQDEQRSPSAAPPPIVFSPMHGPGYFRACPSIGCRWHLHGRVLSEILEAYEIHWGVKHSDATRSLRAAGGFVSGPQPVLVGEKDGLWFLLVDHLELARGKTPQAEIEATADTPIDPADIHSDDAMLSAVASEGITPLTPVAEEIRVVLNRYSAEAPSGTPDYILANYLIDCLKAFNEAVSLRAVWRGEPIEQMVRHIDKER